METLSCGETMASASKSTSAMSLLIFSSHVHLCGLISKLGRHFGKGIGRICGPRRTFGMASEISKIVDTS